MGALFEAKGIKKNFFQKQALQGVDLVLEKGRILGLLGPNGSGKTTLMKIIIGLQKPSAGELQIDGAAPGVYTKSIVSYLPDQNPLFSWMRIMDAVSFYQDFYTDFDTKKAIEMLQFMNLNGNDKVKNLSKGMLEKLMLTLTLSRNAKLYILDEPLGGVDPVSREKIIDSILNNYNEDSSVIISTHLVNDVERLFDEVAMIHEGRIILQGNAEDLRIQHSKSIDELYREVFRNA